MPSPSYMPCFVIWIGVGSPASLSVDTHQRKPSQPTDLFTLLRSNAVSEARFPFTVQVLSIGHDRLASRSEWCVQLTSPVGRLTCSIGPRSLSLLSKGGRRQYLRVKCSALVPNHWYTNHGRHISRC
ncbi:hypothetical protein B0T13DRAFT_68106 [Neurospora crassa]|nr:hypothetical protein B0T13DRAFT_68106 [Neurospora crassa]